MFITKECSWCKQTFEVQNCYDKRIKSCSQRCADLKRRNGHDAIVERKCEWCNEIFKVKFKLRTQRFCNRSCASKPSWNLGLDMSDPKLRQTIERSASTKARLMNEGKFKLVTRGKSSSFESKKLQKVVHCRSTYERCYYEFLDNDPAVLTFHVEPFFIKYTFNGSVHRYHPDVLVTYTNGQRSLVEVKPKALLKLPQNLAKQIAAIEWCEKNDATFKLITESDLPMNELFIRSCA